MAITPAMIADALRAIGHPATAPEIRDVLLNLFPTTPMGRTPLQSVRARLQENSSDSSQYTGRTDLFRRVTPVEARQGVWELRLLQTRQVDYEKQGNARGWIMDEAEVDITEEGRHRLRTHLLRERNTKIIRRFKATLHTFACRICNFDFREKYGDVGAEYIEAHHTLPIADGVRQTKLEDLVAICSNCHRMLHRNGLMDWQQLRRIVRPGDPD